MPVLTINIFFVSSLTLSITSLSIIVILLLFGQEKIHKIYALHNLAVLLWAICATLTAKTTDPFLSVIYFKFGAFFANTLPICMLYLTQNWTKKYNIRLTFLFILQLWLIIILLFDSELIFKNSLTTFYGVFLIPYPGNLQIPWFISWLFLVFVAHSPLLQYYFQQNEFEKLKLKYFLFASIIGFIAGSLNFLLPWEFHYSVYGNFGISLYCIILTYAFLKHRLMGVKVVFQKGISYSILIATFIGLYLILIMFAEILFRGILGYRSTFISLFSAFILAMLFNPIRNKIQRLLDKIFLGKTSEEFAHENALLKQELERSERLKTASTLALGLAHEIKNPLTTIKTFAEFLPEKFVDKEFVNKFSRLIPSEVERINSIVHQLLDFSKPIPPSFKNTNIHKLISEILLFLNNDLLKYKIKLSESYYDNDTKIMVDPDQLKQALLNILLNAIDSMFHGGLITIETKITDNSLQISISDSGCGISKEDLPHIFDPFFTKKDEGNGLGLAITHQIINNHKGMIKVESKEGLGTTFIISLPCSTL